MRLSIVHGGQTGVDRGAHRAAVELGVPIDGYMPRDLRDELGQIPSWVSQHLRVASGGLADRTTRNVIMSAAVLLIVENRHNPYRTPGTLWTAKQARKNDVPCRAVDEDNYEAAIPWLVEIVRENGVDDPQNDFPLMVAGPRRIMWAAGEQAAFDIVTRLVPKLRGSL